MTLIIETDLGSIKKNQRAKYLGQGSSSSKVIVRTHCSKVGRDVTLHPNAASLMYELLELSRGSMLK